ncbi:YdcF family protein [Sphingomonas sp. PL-96]|uniref:ElyC/SanA/YdcF family protein n=1 Tax=Sphingomonas sp. PL-96 TaxID=2887201 RepID=UPI001E5FAC66|nr:ElyC/SanA/YdcF family protein [Sphingomonas sp. PL-96]MCC2977797.1 YdcF family protein [Sphingomonas sp. PL-96]
MLRITCAAAIFAAAVQPALAAPVRDRAAEALSQRLFPILDAVGGSPETVARLRADRALAPMLAARTQRTAACAEEAPCVAEAALWSEQEQVALAGALDRAATPMLRERRLVPDDGVAAGIAREVRGLNAILRVYALGMPARYPGIDGPSVAFGSSEAQTRLAAAVHLRDTPRQGSAQALDPSVELGLALLDVNDRTDAAGFEPIDGGDNAAATARARGLDWARYRYSAIVLTGIGPEVREMPLSPGGKYHVRLAANRFAAGDAPFIIVSGGRAHPHSTGFTEAVEMRRALIDRYDVPADAIVIEPYARHTTTNLRNTTRRLMALGAPLDRDAVIVSNAAQSSYIEGPAFAARNQKELGYQPGAIGKRLSPTELTFRPSPVSARVDPLDPLDP